MKSFCPPIRALFIGIFVLFSASAMAQPANDECVNAVTLTSSTSCVNTSGTIVNSTYNPSSFTPGCGATNKSDVWFKFVALSTTHTVTISSGPSQVRVELFSGTCGSLTSLICGNATLTSSSLTIGATYYIRVYAQNNNTSSFNICVTHTAPANDDCAGAVSLTSGTTCANIAGTLNAATANGSTPLGCFGAGTYYDVWFSFVAAATTETVTISSLGANFTNPQLQIYGGTCGALTNLTACGTTTVTKSGLTIGTTYYVRVANLNANPSGGGSVANFNICVTHTGPANDDCAGAVSLTSSLSCVNTAGTLVGATPTTIASIGCGVATRNDVWYSFVAVSSSQTITLSSAPANPRLQVFSGTCGALVSVACGNASVTATGLTVGSTYYVRVYTDPSTISASNTFNICVTHTLPANDDCAGAILLTSYTSCVNTAGTLNLATANGTTALGCFAAGTYYDVWYSFVAVATTHTVTLSSVGGNITNPRIQLYSSTCTALGAPICGTTSVVQTGLTVGTTYKIRVSNLGADPSGTGSLANFNICVTHTGLVGDDCGGAVPITSNTSCINTTGTTVGATYVATGFTNCSGNTAGDVWYSFVAQSPTPTLTAVSTSGNMRIQVEIYSGTCGSLTCVDNSSGNSTTKILTPVTSLTIGQTYYVRITCSTASTTTFTLCIVDPVMSAPPVNDACSAATNLTPGSSCVNTAGTMAGATVSSPAVATSCGTPGADVWYTFTATSVFPTITLSSPGSSLTGTTGIQIYSGTCAALTPVACATGTSLIPGGTGLTLGATYYVRVFTTNTYTGGSNWTFNICITNPGTSSSATIDYSKSYINVTKQTTGGSVEPGDILEIRATFVVRSGSVDSLSFYDTLHNNNGFTLLSNTIALQTNEGKIFRYDSPTKVAFTDAFDTDPGRYYINGLDTVVQINIGPTASGTKRGALSNTSHPSVYNSTCIVMATYRVQVYAGYNTKINWGGGSFTYKDGANMKLVTFKNDSLVVYVSPGLCSSALSTVNKVGVETNGTFNQPAIAAPLARNRGTSTAVPSYTYSVFKTGGGPQDYFYGVTNNTSATYATTNLYPKSTLGSSIPQRVFSHWDITGDHTGALNTAKGNPPCDTTLPRSASNPCGYMLVVNAAYKTDTAFRSTITGLCPNTYYEISAWIKNICYKCGCDSTGIGAASNPNTGYVPLAAGDSSGVQPNLAFQVNGQDYYSTGNIAYTGTGGAITQTGSDTTNSWVKRGFVYKTGLTQTGFELVIRNNAPGGGGNDWAIDDIVVSSCLPIMTYSPSLTPNVCDSNTVTIYDTVRSSYENYTYYKWQRSTDGGATWVDMTAALGPATPFWNGTAWEYVASYVIPPQDATPSHNSDLYRMIVATTSANLSDANCQATDVVSIITLNVIDCGIPLKVETLSFNGKLINDHSHLQWSTTGEDEPVKYEVERSRDGINFSFAGSLNSTGNGNPGAVNFYNFIDPVAVTGKVWYRIAIVNGKSKKKYSRVLVLNNSENHFDIVSAINPFSEEIQFDVSIPEDGKLDVKLVDIVGKSVSEKTYRVYTGVNSLNLENMGRLPSGMYILQVRYKDAIVNKKLLKK